MIGVKQANPANLARIDGLQIYAGNDDMLVEVLELGEPGGILTGSHVFGDEMRRMIDEPGRRREIHASLADVYRDMAIAPAALHSKAALNLIGIEVGAPRLPYVELDESERAASSAACSSVTACCHSSDKLTGTLKCSPSVAWGRSART